MVELLPTLHRDKSSSEVKVVSPTNVHRVMSTSLPTLWDKSEAKALPPANILQMPRLDIQRVSLNLPSMRAHANNISHA